MSYVLYGARHHLPRDCICEVPEVAHLLLCFVLFT